MRALILAMAALIAFSAIAEAKPRGKKAKWKGGSYAERSYDVYRSGPRRGFTQGEFDRLPIRITKPDNARHYIYQNYPYWAAHAMEPKKWW